VWGIAAGVSLGQSDESLPPERRIAYYRAMAAEALQLAQTASDEAQKASFLDIAARWNVLAAEVERLLTREAEAARKDASSAQSNGNRT
jgi:hypothetical protein